MSADNKQPSAATKPVGLALLREPFPKHQISLLPKHRKDATKGDCRVCGGYHGLPAIHVEYVGHAALTYRLLDVDPNWIWEPVAYGDDGLPKVDKDGGLWIRLTVLGMTRLGYGDADGKVGPAAMKERIGDALRNAAMRFGAALELWHKGDLNPDVTVDDAAEGSDDTPRSEPEQSRVRSTAAPAEGSDLKAAPMASAGQMAWLKKKAGTVASAKDILAKHNVALDGAITSAQFDAVKSDFLKA